MNPPIRSIILERMTTDQHGVFITLEGIEGVGKSTALQFIQGVLQTAQIPHLVTREPGGADSAVSEAIRQVLLAKHSEPMFPETELLLMFASRTQHLQKTIRPALARGEWVVSDRFMDASFAYQGAGRGLDLARIDDLTAWLVGSTRPDLTILLDAPPAVGVQRMAGRGTKDRIEDETDTFFDRVRQGYLERAKQDPDRFALIDASLDVSAVQAQISDALQPLLDAVHSS